MASNYENGQYVFARNFGGRWFVIGTPINGSNIHKAYAKADAPASGSITCYLDTDETGEEIPVSCEVVGGTNLNAAIPRLENGDRITVWKDGSTWRSTMTFQASEDCT